MKVLIVNHFPLVGSGSGIYVMNIAKSLIKKGHEVCIIMPENTTKIMKIDKVKIHPVFFFREEIIEGQLDFNFPCMDPHPRSSFLFKDMTKNQIEQYEAAFRRAIEEEINEFNPDIIHAQHIWIITGLAVDYKIPVIVTSHGSDIMGYYQTDKYHTYTEKSVKGCKKIIAISKNNKEKINEIYSEYKNKIAEIPNGYNPELFYREEYNKEEVLKFFNINKKYDKIVCFAGRFAKNKGIDILLKSAQIYEQDNILTIIAGDGKEYKSLKLLKEKLKLKNVIFVGDQKQEMLRKIYNISNVSVVPSREEAFGLVALEAIACGTPVIATKQGGMIDFVTEDVGTLIEKDNVEQLANEIKKILNKEKEFDKDYLQNYAKNNYSQEKLMDKLLELYEEVRKNKNAI